MQRKEVGREVTLNGLNICRGEQFDQVPDLEYQRGQLELKKQQLTLNTDQLTKDLEAIKDKTAAADKELAALEDEYRNALGLLAGSEAV